MKTSEFKKRLRKLIYFVHEEGDFLDIRSSTGKQCANISTVSNSLKLDTANLELSKLCIEYAETPIEEREDEKKYIVVLPDPRNSEDIVYTLKKRGDSVEIARCHKSGLEGLTESEIKRNHEYLWQFAKEVEG
jgi:hypothetical protein